MAKAALPRPDDAVTGNMAQWYSTQQLIGLPGMPGSERGVQMWGKKIEKNLALSRAKVRGKGQEYALKSLPEETRQHLMGAYAEQVLACLPESLAEKPLVLAPREGPSRVPGMPPVRPAPVAGVVVSNPLVPSEYQTGTQRAVGSARRAVLEAVRRLQRTAGVSERAAMQTLLVQGAAGQLGQDTATAMLTLARDGRGKKSNRPNQMPSLRTLQGWMARAREDETLEGRNASGGVADNLAPKLPQPDMTMAPWMLLALELKRRPQKPTTALVLRQLQEAWTPYSQRWMRRELTQRHGSAPTEEAVVRTAAQLVVPSYGQLSEFFREKVSVLAMAEGQNLGSALRAKKFYQKRSSVGMEPWLEVHADGWGTHFLAPHPVHGEYVQWEVWHFHDVATRYTSPFALGLSESAPVILKGLELCIRTGGVPAVWQTDSTGAVKNKGVEFDPVTSLSALVGLTVVHPVTVGNSQANGIAENYNTYLDRESRALATYMHPTRMDTLAFKQVRKYTGQMVKAAAKGDSAARDSARAAALRVGKGILFESVAEMVAWLEQVRVRGNNTPHSSLPQWVDDSGRMRHQTPQEALDHARERGWKPVSMTEGELIEVFRPHQVRRVTRQIVRANKQDYHHPDLGAYEGQDVVVAEDLMDGTQVWVKDMSKRLICVAAYVVGSSYRCQSRYETSQAKRMDAQIKRREDQIEGIRDGMDPDRMPLDVPALEHSPGLVLPMGARWALNGAPAADVVDAVTTVDAAATVATASAPAATDTPADTDTAPAANKYSDPRDLAMFLHGARIEAEEAEEARQPQRAMSAQDERDALAKRLGFWTDDEDEGENETGKEGARKAS